MTTWLDQGAEFDLSLRYRYRLWRTWDTTRPAAVFCMLNPSTADAEVEDPTIRRCLGYARAWGAGKLVVVNIFALRSTDPRALYSDPDPVGGRPNDWNIERAAQDDCGWFVCAWGVHGAHRGRGAAVRELVGARAKCLGLTKDGHPKHPLYLRGDLRPEPMP